VSPGKWSNNLGGKKTLSQKSSVRQHEKKRGARKRLEMGTRRLSANRGNWINQKGGKEEGGGFHRWGETERGKELGNVVERNAALCWGNVGKATYGSTGARVKCYPLILVRSGKAA